MLFTTVSVAFYFSIMLGIAISSQILFGEKSHRGIIVTIPPKKAEKLEAKRPLHVNNVCHVAEAELKGFLPG